MTETVRAIHFTCPGCGAPEMAWDAGIAKLKCPYCAHQMDVPQRADDAAVAAHQERPLAEGLLLAREQRGGGLGTEVRTTECRTCGATVNFAGVAIASRCDFCGSDQVVEQASSQRSIRPQSLVPFAIEQSAATDKFRHWLTKLWFRPNDLKRLAQVGEIHGVYVPYWTFDANVSSQWTAQAGYYYYVTETYTTTENGKPVQRTRQVRHTRWTSASGSRQDRYDDVLVTASRGLPHELADRLTTFDTSKLVAYDPHYLAGWRAEEYAVELDQAWTLGSDKIANSQRSRCAGDVPGDTHRALDVRNQFFNETFKHVLLPLWIASYRYRDEAYRFLVNGQTGEVTGEAPWSWIKITLAVLLALVVAAIVLYVVR